MKVVTYRGADDPRDPTTRFCVQHEGKSFYFPTGVPLEVNDEVAEIAGAQDGHDFEIAAPKGHGGSKKDDQAATAATKGD